MTNRSQSTFHNSTFNSTPYFPSFDDLWSANGTIIQPNVIPFNTYCLRRSTSSPHTPHNTTTVSIVNKTPPAVGTRRPPTLMTTIDNLLNSVVTHSSRTPTTRSPTTAFSPDYHRPTRTHHVPPRILCSLLQFFISPTWRS